MVLSAFGTKFSSSFFSENLKMTLQGVIDKWCLLSKVASRSISSSQHESTLYWYVTESQKPNKNFLPQPMESGNDNTLITKLNFRLCWLKGFPELTSHSEFDAFFKEKPQKSEETSEAAQFWPHAKCSLRAQVLIIWGFSLGFHSNPPVPSKIQRK